MIVRIEMRIVRTIAMEIVIRIILVIVIRIVIVVPAEAGVVGGAGVGGKAQGLFDLNDMRTHWSYLRVLQVPSLLSFNLLVPWAARTAPLIQAAVRYCLTRWLTSWKHYEYPDSNRNVQSARQRKAAGHPYMPQTITTIPYCI